MKTPSILEIIWLNILYPLILFISWLNLIGALIADLSSDDNKYDIWIIKAASMLTVLLVNDIWQKMGCGND